jgi:hypothetical protein
MERDELPEGHFCFLDEFEKHGLRRCFIKDILWRGIVSKDDL